MQVNHTGYQPQRLFTLKLVGAAKGSAQKMSGESHTGYSAPSFADGSQPSNSTSDSPQVVTKKIRAGKANAMPARGHVVNLTDDKANISSTSEDEKARPTAERKNKHKKSLEKRE